MANLGTGSLQLTLNGDNLVKGLKSTLSEVLAFSTKINGNLSIISAGPQGAAIAGIKEMISLFNSFAESIDKTSKMSRTLGTSVESLTGLHLAGQLQGVANEDLDKFLAKYQIAVAGASSGNEELKKTFDELGLSAKDLKKLDLADQMIMITNALNKFKPEDRMSLAKSLGGKGAMSVMPLIAKGSADIAEAMSQVKGTITDEQAQKVELMNEAFIRASKSIKAVGRDLVINLAEPMKDIADLIPKIVKESKKAIDPRDTYTWAIGARGVYGARRLASGGTMDTYDQYKIKDKQKQDALKQKSDEERIANLNKSDAIDKEELTNEEYKKFIRTMGIANDTIGMTTHEVELYKISLLGLSPKQMEAAKSIVATNQALTDKQHIIAKQGKMDAMLGEEHRAFTDGKKLFEDTLGPVEKFTNAIYNLNQLWNTVDKNNDHAISMLTYKRAVSATYDELKKMFDVENHLPSGFAAGSREAIETIINANQRTKVDDRGAEMTKVLEQANEYQKRTAENTEQIFNEMKQRGLLGQI